MSTLVTKVEKDGQAKDPKDVLKIIEKNKIEIIDLKFNDLPGLWQHFSIPAEDVMDVESPTSIWTDGIGFDGSSIRGFQKIHESDMILMLIPYLAWVSFAALLNFSFLILN